MLGGEQGEGEVAKGEKVSFGGVQFHAWANGGASQGQATSHQSTGQQLWAGWGWGWGSLSGARAGALGALAKKGATLKTVGTTASRYSVRGQLRRGVLDTPAMPAVLLAGPGFSWPVDRPCRSPPSPAWV